MTDATTTVTIGGQEVELETPSSQAEVWAVIEEGARKPTFAVAAALGICWPRTSRWPGQARPEMLRCRFDGLVYGARVIDSLRAAGIPMPEIIAAGARAFELVTPLAISEEDVAATETFCGAPADK